jgi:hypothetical protein
MQSKFVAEPHLVARQTETVNRPDIAAGFLILPREAALRLKISQKTLTTHVKAGKIPYVNVGAGKVRPRRMFRIEEIDRFILDQTIRDRPRCPSSNTKRRHTTTTTSDTGAVGFMEARAARSAAKLSK